MKKQNNKGFSLVELIVVIAIMAVLVGVLAPQYMKYVNNAKISTDITNVDNAVNAINAAIADTTITEDEIATIMAAEDAFAEACEEAGFEVPASKLNGKFVNFSMDSVQGVKYLDIEVGEGTYQIYPNPNNTTASDDVNIGVNDATKGLKK